MKRLAAIAILGCSLASPLAAHAAATAPPLADGDRAATVTINDRPLSDDTNHVVAFKRDKEIYVSLEDLKQMVSGTMKRTGSKYTVRSFTGDSNSHVYVFTIGSTKAIAHGQPVSLHAPVIETYGHVYIPMSFFEADALVTHVQYNGDHRSANVVIPGTTLF